MLESKPLNKIIFIDIETVPQKKSFYDLSPRMQELFQWRFRKEYAELGLGRAEHYIREANESALRNFEKRNVPVPSQDTIKTYALENMNADDRIKMESLYQNKASLFAEFGKIVCCSIGWFDIKDNVEILPDQELSFKTISFSGDDEKQILQRFHYKLGNVLNMPFNHTHHFCGHNLKIFDMPFLAKRFILNGLSLPKMLDFVDKKPWELLYFIDTKDVWTFGVRDNAISLDLLCEAFGVPSSKSDIKGSDVRRVYYEDKDIERIARYCEQDVLAVGVVYIRMKSMSNKVIKL